MLGNNLSVILGLGLGAGILLVILVLWSLAWKGFAMWIAAGENKVWWFIPIMIFNTVGILEIIYIFFFSQWGKNCINKMKNKKNNSNKESKDNTSDCECTSCEGCECDCHKSV